MSYEQELLERYDSAALTLCDRWEAMNRRLRRITSANAHGVGHIAIAAAILVVADVLDDIYSHVGGRY